MTKLPSCRVDADVCGRAVETLDCPVQGRDCAVRGLFWPVVGGRLEAGLDEPLV